MSSIATYFRPDLRTICEDVQRLLDQFEVKDDVAVPEVRRALHRILIECSVAYPDDDESPSNFISSLRVLARDSGAERVRPILIYLIGAADCPEKIRLEAEKLLLNCSAEATTQKPRNRLIEWFTGTLERIDGDDAHVTLADSQGREYYAEFQASMFTGRQINEGGQFFCLVQNEAEGTKVVLLPRDPHKLTDEDWARIKVECDGLFEHYEEDEGPP